MAIETTMPGRTCAPNVLRTYSPSGCRLRRVEQQLAAPEEHATQETRHRHDNMPVRDGLPQLLDVLTDELEQRRLPRPPGPLDPEADLHAAIPAGGRETGDSTRRSLASWHECDGRWQACTLSRSNQDHRKYAEIQKNPRVTPYYANHAKATGYVSLTGRAVLVEDMQEVLKRKRAYWDSAFPGLKNIVLIHVIPERMEVVYYKAGLGGNPTTFAPTAIDLNPPAAPTTPKP